MDQFYIITNQVKDKEFKVTNQIEQYLRDRGKNCIVNNNVSGNEIDRFEPDCVLVVGGDGTMIRAARQLRKYDVPMLGVNMGTVGYLTEVDPGNLYEELDLLLEENYVVEKRMMLESVFSSGKKESALNDIVLTRAGSLCVICFNIYVNGELLNTYSADGIIVSTPTGSTGYNLSAGGPIVEPTARMIVLTPICSHALNTSSIVLSANDKIRIELCSGIDNKPQEAGISVDGNNMIALKEGECVEISAAKETTKFLKINKVSFLETLRTKMRGN